MFAITTLILLMTGVVGTNFNMVLYQAVLPLGTSARDAIQHTLKETYRQSSTEEAPTNYDGNKPGSRHPHV